MNKTRYFNQGLKSLIFLAFYRYLFWSCVHLISAFMYSAAWIQTGVGFNSWLQIPEYTNIICAIMYLVIFFLLCKTNFERIITYYAYCILMYIKYLDISKLLP